MACTRTLRTTVLLQLLCIATFYTYGRLTLLLPHADAATTTVHDLTDYEQEILDEFRSNVIHLIHKDYMKTDAYLLRWLNVADFDLHDAIQRLKKSLAWRKEKNIDTIISEDYKFIDEAYPVVVDGTDKDGRPVIYAHVGSYDFRQIAISGQERTYQRYSIRLFELFEEYMHYLRETSGSQNVTQITCIYDLSGFNLKQGGCYQCVKMLPESILNFEPNYPGVFYRVFLINCPAIFYNIISVSRNFLSEQSKKSMQVFGYDKAKWTAALLDQIPSDQLAVKYGGQRIIPQDRSSLAKNPLIQNVRDRAQQVEQTYYVIESAESQSPPRKKLEPETKGQVGREEERIPRQAQHKKFETPNNQPNHLTRHSHEGQKHHHHYKVNAAIATGNASDSNVNGYEVYQEQHQSTHHLYQQDEPAIVGIGGKQAHGEGVSNKMRSSSSSSSLRVIHSGMLVFIQSFAIKIRNFY